MANHTPRHLRSPSLRGILLLALLTPLLALAATFDIPVQPAPSAINAFIKQAKVEVTYRYDDLKDIRTNEVKGEFETEVALNRLVESTGIEVARTTGGNFALRKDSGALPGSIEGQVRDESGKPVAGARVSLVGSDNQILTDRRGRFLLESVPAGAQAVSILAEGMQRTRVTDVAVKSGHRHTLSSIMIPAAVAGITQLEDYIVSAKKNDGVIELDPYAVDASRPRPFSTASIDLIRTEDDVLPFNVFTAAEIQQSGATDLAEFFRNRLTQNFTSTIREERDFSVHGSGSESNGLSGLNFGGAGAYGPLGGDSLVILVNGRRLPNTYTGNTSVPANGDFRGIPVASIERVEVLGSAASAIYGAGANAGVINIITKQNFRGGSVVLQYETPDHGNARKRSVELSYSMPLKWGTNLHLNYSARDVVPLSIEDRADITVERSRAIIMAKAPTIIANESAPPAGATPNIRSLSGTPLFGGGSPHFTSVPEGYSGGGGIDAFRARAGIYNLELAENTGFTNGIARQTLLGNERKDISLNIGLTHTFNHHHRASLEYTSRTSGSGSNGRSGLGQFVVPSNAPANPFGTSVIVVAYDPRLSTPDMHHRYRLKNESFTGTLHSTLGEWQAILDASLIMGTYETSEIKFSGFTNALGSYPVYTNPLITGMYNPFVDMRTTAPAPDEFYNTFNRGVNFGIRKTDTYQISAKASGPTISLPHGVVTATVGAEWLRYDAHKSLSILGVRNSMGQPVLIGSMENPRSIFKTDTYSLYSELVAPILARDSFVPYIENLELFGAGRIARYEWSGSTLSSSEAVISGNTWTATYPNAKQITYSNEPYVHTLGLRLDIPVGFALRVSRSIGFQPPKMDQITEDLPPTRSTTAIDRRQDRSIVLESTQYRTGGNPDLSPENSIATNIGVIFDSRSTLGFRASLDYVENERKNAISGMSVQAILDLEANDPQMAARVQRDQGGAVTFVDARSINLLAITSRRADLTLEQRVPNVFGGELMVSATVTKNLSFKMQSSATVAAQEQVRNSEAAWNDAFPKWNGNAQVQWSTEKLSIGWSSRLYDDLLIRRSRIAVNGSDRIPQEFEHDVFLNWRLGKDSLQGIDRILSGTSIMVGCKNLFNRDPRMLITLSDLQGYGIFGGDSVYGRTFWLQLRKNF